MFDKRSECVTDKMETARMNIDSNFSKLQMHWVFLLRKEKSTFRNETNGKQREDLSARAGVSFLAVTELLM